MIESRLKTTVFTLALFISTNSALWGLPRLPKQGDQAFLKPIASHVPGELNYDTLLNFLTKTDGSSMGYNATSAELKDYARQVLNHRDFDESELQAFAKYIQNGTNRLTPNIKTDILEHFVFPAANQKGIQLASATKPVERISYNKIAAGLRTLAIHVQGIHNTNINPYQKRKSSVEGLPEKTVAYDALEQFKKLKPADQTTVLKRLSAPERASLLLPEQKVSRKLRKALESIQSQERQSSPTRRAPTQHSSSSRTSSPDRWGAGPSSSNYTRTYSPFRRYSPTRRIGWEAGPSSPTSARSHSPYRRYSPARTENFIQLSSTPQIQKKESLSNLLYHFVYGDSVTQAEAAQKIILQYSREEAVQQLKKHIDKDWWLGSAKENSDAIISALKEALTNAQKAGAKEKSSAGTTNSQQVATGLPSRQIITSTNRAEPSPLPSSLATIAAQPRSSSSTTLY